MAYELPPNKNELILIENACNDFNNVNKDLNECSQKIRTSLDNTGLTKHILIENNKNIKSKNKNKKDKDNNLLKRIDKKNKRGVVIKIES